MPPASSSNTSLSNAQVNVSYGTGSASTGGASTTGESVADDGYGGGDDVPADHKLATVNDLGLGSTGSSGTAGSGINGSGASSNSGIRVTGEDAKKWTAGIKTKANEQVALGERAAVNAASQTAAGNGGGLFGGSSFLSSLLPPAQINKALGVAGKLGVNTSTITGGLATLNNIGGIASNAGGSLTSLARNATSMGTLNLGGLTTAGTSISSTVASLGSGGNLSLASVKTAATSIQADVSTVQRIATQ